MKRTMIYLPDETHRGLKKLAFEAGSSIGELIRKAVDVVSVEKNEDIRDMEAEIAKYRANPESAISLKELRRRKKVNA